jgi:hypothetical protein
MRWYSILALLLLYCLVVRFCAFARCAAGLPQSQRFPKHPCIVYCCAVRPVPCYLLPGDEPTPAMLVFQHPTADSAQQQPQQQRHCVDFRRLAQANLSPPAMHGRTGWQFSWGTCPCGSTYFHPSCTHLHPSCTCGHSSAWGLCCPTSPVRLYLCAVPAYTAVAVYCLCPEQGVKLFGVFTVR